MDLSSKRGNDKERPCKACFSYEDMLRMAGKQAAAKEKQQRGDAKAEGTSVGGTASEEERPKRRKDCPLDKDELGRSTWNLLHTMSVYYPEQPTEQERRDMRDTLIGVSKTYPCDHCAADFREDLSKHPPALESRSTLAQWMCEAHNRVNEKLGKPRFDCSRVMERWYDGWRDGSCD